MTALVLAILSVSTPIYTGFDGSISIATRYQSMPSQWISACDEWLTKQSPKYRKIVHYQISCLVCLAKRLNMIEKKTYWRQTGLLMQTAIIDGLHNESMKRRIWAVVCELDLQNTFEFGLPTLLHSIEADVAPPANINDEDFNEVSKDIPISKPPDKFTDSSYQSYSSRSWTLRLEISRRLFSAGLPKSLDYSDALRYTHEVMQAIDSLPSWHIEEEMEIRSSPERQGFPYAFLRFQLKECILAIHRPYLHRNESGFWLSKVVCFHTSHDVLLLNSKLAGLGAQNLTMVRHDLLLASLTLTRLTILQPKGQSCHSQSQPKEHTYIKYAMFGICIVLHLIKTLTSWVGSTSIFLTGCQSTIDLLEECLPLTEETYWRCSRAEPWCFVTMCAAIMLLRIHLGSLSRQAAKACFVQRFQDLHYKHIGRQQTSLQQSVNIDPIEPASVSILLSPYRDSCHHPQETLSCNSSIIPLSYFELTFVARRSLVARL